MNERYAQFLTLVGFFVSLIFCIQTPLDPAVMVVVIVGSSMFFNIMGTMTVGMYIKHSDLKEGYHLKRDSYEGTLDLFVREIEKREVKIKKMEEFVRSYRAEYDYLNER